MTILFGPASYASAQSALFYTVSDAKASDPVTYPNYKYIADVYINGLFVTRLKRFPDPVNNYGVFNVGAIVREFVGIVFHPVGGLASFANGPGQFYSDIQLKFGEEYGVTATYNITVDGTRRVFNYYTRLLHRTITPLSDFANKIPTNGAKIASNQSTFKASLSTDMLFVNYFATVAGNIDITVVGNGTYTTTVNIANAGYLVTFNISPVLINILRADTINSTLDFYTVTIATETFRVKLFCEPLYVPYHLHFLNQWGGFETAIFNKVGRQNVKVDRKSFGTLSYKVDNSGQISFYDDSFTVYETNYNYANTFTKTFTLNSDVLSDLEYIWLEDLIESPLIYLQINELNYPVAITNTDYEVKRNVNETDLSNLTLTLDTGKVFNAQFR